MDCDRAICAILVEEQIAKSGPANVRRILQHGLKHRFQFAGRTADDFQHLRGRRLLLQRLAQFLSALLFGVEQPHVLDGDHCLVGEGLGQFNLLLREGTRRRA